VPEAVLVTIIIAAFLFLIIDIWRERNRRRR
jgi:hypothetical protein